MQRYASAMAQLERDPGGPPRPAHLTATAFIDSDHQAVRGFAQRAVEGATETHEQIGRLFALVRDEIRYDPYTVSADPTDYVAGNVIERGAAYCVPKAVVLTAGARSLGIPARLGFSDVRNHLQSERLAALMGTDVFVFTATARCTSAVPDAKRPRPSTPPFASASALPRWS
jgi:transglutaminase-like putative cysteine protease